MLINRRVSLEFCGYADALINGRENTSSISYETPSKMNNSIDIC